jgi:2-succinyl-6-hydroxy-2,4-cyclohexadiene-1-carboxylate synthase
LHTVWIRALRGPSRRAARWPGMSAPPYLLLHGFLGRGANWAPVVERLGGARALCPDLPGHGAAVGLPADAYTMDGAARRLVEALDAAQVERAVVAGYSMGGRLALFFALRHPERVRALALLGASPGLASEAARAARRALDAERAAAIRADLPAFLDAWYRLPLFADLSPAQRTQLISDRAAHNEPAELGRSLAGMGTGAQPWLGEDLRALRVPGVAVAVAGARDAAYVRAAREMAAAGPFRAEIVPDAGHALLAQAPEAVAALLTTL